MGERYADLVCIDEGDSIHILKAHITVAASYLRATFLRLAKIADPSQRFAQVCDLVYEVIAEEGFEIQKFKEIESYISEDFFKEILAYNDTQINEMFKNLYISCLKYIG